MRRFVRYSMVFIACQLFWTSGVSAGPRFAASPVQERAGAAFHLLYDFPAGAYPFAGLNSANGLLYGTDYGNGRGDAFAATTAGVVTLLHHFTGVPDGAVPDALTVADGQLYGVTQLGGNSAPNYSTGCGTVFAVSSSGSETLLSPFDCTKSWYPNGKLVRYNGSLFGVTTSGGAHDSGTFFVAHDDGKKNTLYSFPGPPNEEPPQFGLTELGGTFYGISDGGRGGREEIFALLPTGAERVVYTFDDPHGRLVLPYNRLTAVNGVLYGTTLEGGTNQDGTIYSMTPSGSLTVLADLSTIGGVAPSSPLIAMGGALFGTTEDGGKFNQGLIFKLTDAGVLTVIHRFRGPDGAAPRGELTVIGRSLYGTTQYGGAKNAGTLYRMTP